MRVELEVPHLEPNLRAARQSRTAQAAECEKEVSVVEVTQPGNFAVAASTNTLSLQLSSCMCCLQPPPVFCGTHSGQAFSQQPPGQLGQGPW